MNVLSSSISNPPIAPSTPLARHRARISNYRSLVTKLEAYIPGDSRVVHYVPRKSGLQSPACLPRCVMLIITSEKRKKRERERKKEKCRLSYYSYSQNKYPIQIKEPQYHEVNVDQYVAIALSRACPPRRPFKVQLLAFQPHRRPTVSRRDLASMRRGLSITDRRSETQTDNSDRLPVQNSAARETRRCTHDISRPYANPRAI